MNPRFMLTSLPSLILECLERDSALDSILSGDVGYVPHGGARVVAKSDGDNQHPLMHRHDRLRYLALQACCHTSGLCSRNPHDQLLLELPPLPLLWNVS